MLYFSFHLKITFLSVQCGIIQLFKQGIIYKQKETFQLFVTWRADVLLEQRQEKKCVYISQLQVIGENKLAGVNLDDLREIGRRESLDVNFSLLLRGPCSVVLLSFFRTELLLYDYRNKNR